MGSVLPGRPQPRHGKRPALAARFPVHVTMRVRRDVTRLRRFELVKVLRAAFVHGCRRGEFRICQFSIQGNHIHLIPPPEMRTVAAAETWLLRVGWKRSPHGLLSITEIPPAGR